MINWVNFCNNTKMSRIVFTRGVQQPAAAADERHRTCCPRGASRTWWTWRRGTRRVWPVAVTGRRWRRARRRRRRAPSIRPPCACRRRVSRRTRHRTRTRTTRGNRPWRACTAVRTRPGSVRCRYRPAGRPTVFSTSRRPCSTGPPTRAVFRAWRNSNRNRAATRTAIWPRCTRRGTRRPSTLRTAGERSRPNPSAAAAAAAAATRQPPCDFRPSRAFAPWTKTSSSTTTAPRPPSPSRRSFAWQRDDFTGMREGRRRQTFFFF